jgi:trk system potassium uptake protein
MIQLLQRIPFLLELFFNGSFIFLFSLKITGRLPAFVSQDWLEQALNVGAHLAPLFIIVQALNYYFKSDGVEDFLRKYVFSIIVVVPLLITWGDLDFAYWLSSAHLLASVMALYEGDSEPNVFEERINERESWTRFIKLSPAQIVIFSFLSVIMLGTFLLMLPIASTSEQSIGFLNAFFMATSATCVTGLATLTVSSDFTLFGQIVLLVLLQIGGLSIMTLYSSIALLLGRSLQMRDRLVMQDLLDINSLDDLLAMILDVIKFTLIIELWGALILTVGFLFAGHEFGEALYYGIFHSISAFCNAGISLFPNSMENYVTQPLIVTTIAVLGTLGGLGFIVLKECREILFRGRAISRISLHTRIVLVASFTLTILGALFFFFSEFLNSLDGYSFASKLQISIFHSVMTRTIGFNSLPMDQLMPYTVYLMTLLMFIGGSPGSTAGGVKTTTLAILLYSILSTLKASKVVTIYDREIPSYLIVKVTAITFLSILLISFAILFLLFFEPNMSFIALFFESVSAFGTVGLSLGITADLGNASKVILIFLMFLGRVGPLTLVLAIGQKSFGKGKIDYPDGRIMIG